MQNEILSAKRKHLTLAQKDAIIGYIFILPAVFGLLSFYIYPIISSFVISTYEWNVLSKPVFTGIENYKTLFRDEIYLASLSNTIKWVLFYVPTSILVSFIMALAMDMPVKGIGFFRTVFYIPVITPIICVALLFVWIYNKEFGILNYLLSVAGIPAVGWLNNTHIAIFSISLMSIWKWAGYNMLIMLAALQGIPETLYEAAEIDGVTPFKKLWYIKIPLLKPAFFYIIITSIIDAFQVFTEIYIMTKGGPGYSTYTISYYLYSNAFEYGQMGYACAIAVVLFLIIMTCTLIQNKLLGKNVTY